MRNSGTRYLSLLTIVIFVVQNCVEQMYDDQRMHVSKNPMFAEEFALNIRSYLVQLEPRIGNFRALFKCTA